MNASDDHTDAAPDAAVLRRLSDAVGRCPERVTENAKALFQCFGAQGRPALSLGGPQPRLPQHAEGVPLNMTQQPL
ncbi:hypothetical protein [Kitasatospora sp. A2-31]|uniref:hypothetical protein n=1 Tax=Kitasatospora sp. A2-31 TaxID=2916414 RepID=UPI001EEADDAB|nr:hypothetical protein [Kitasatospora sp. A2-31]MCG6495738.1 hypothetical protein [Kitasatospora sp. A2-31]